MEFITSLIDYSGPLLAALIGVIGANYLVPKAQDHWDKIKKQRDLDLIAVQEFHRLYGEFFAVWKLWDATFREAYKYERTPQFEQDCLTRATAVEGGVESLLVKLAADRPLTREQIDILGASRQAFQSLRKAIQNHENLDWNHADEPHYVALKVLAAHMSGLLANSPGSDSAPTADQAAASIRLITSNVYEATSIDLGKQWVTVGARLAQTSHLPSCPTSDAVARAPAGKRLVKRSARPLH